MSRSSGSGSLRTVRAPMAVHPAPVRRCHDLGPATIERAVVRFAETGLAGNSAKCRIEALVPHPHLVVDRHLPCHDTTAGQGALLPVVHVVLLERARRAESADP